MTTPEEHLNAAGWHLKRALDELPDDTPADLREAIADANTDVQATLQAVREWRETVDDAAVQTAYTGYGDPTEES